MSGTVYLVMRVNRQGKVENAVAEQVNLHTRTSEARVGFLREVLADAAIREARKWTYNLPATGKHVADSYWNIREPVMFTLVPGEDDYGKWEVYVPGPRQPMPWLNDKQVDISPDTVPAGSISQTTSSLHLATPLGGEQAI